MSVRVHGNAAVMRYRSEIEIIFKGTHMARDRYWHTDTYEKRDDSWQVVWSHATAITGYS